MKRAEAAGVLRVIRTVFIVIGIIFLCMGFYKLLVYENPDSSYLDSVNAYVGGDAYNYIINATYFATYSILGMGSLIIATITGVGAMFMSVEQEQRVIVEKKEVSMIDDIESNLPKM